MDTYSITLITPVVALIFEPELLNTNQYFIALSEFIGKTDHQSVLSYLGFSAVFIVFISRVLKLYTHYITRTFGVQCQVRLSKDYLNLSTRTPYHWYIGKNPLTLSHLSYTDILMWSNDYLQRIIVIPSILASCFVVACVITATAPLTGLIGAISFVGLLYLCLRLLKKKLKELANVRRDKSAAVATKSNQIFSGMREIKVNNVGDTFSNDFLKVFYDYSISMVNFKFIQMIPGTVFFLSAQLGLVVFALWISSKNISKGELSAIMALSLLVTSKTIPLFNSLLAEISSIFNTFPHIKAISSILDEIKPLVNNGQTSDKYQLNDTWSSITLNNLSFKYPSADKDSLSSLSYKFERGKMYGLVGTSGSGKSTLVNNILGLLDSTKGSISIDSTDLRDIKKSQWFDKISVVPQKDFFFEDTILANITLGNDIVDIEKVKETLSAVNLWDTIEKLPNKLSTILHGNGDIFSGGQQQRLSLARALYNDAPVLILDEATSSLDIMTEKLISESLMKIKENKTIFIIAHRFNILKPCDEILMIDNGKIVNSGNHDYLLDNCPQFKKYVEEQSL